MAINTEESFFTEVHEGIRIREVELPGRERGFVVEYADSGQHIFFMHTLHNAREFRTGFLAGIRHNEKEKEYRENFEGVTITKQKDENGRTFYKTEDITEARKFAMVTYYLDEALAFRDGYVLGRDGNP